MDVEHSFFLSWFAASAFLADRREITALVCTDPADAFGLMPSVSAKSVLAAKP
jgi:hypothetical protein